jgi:hypothetical protein
MNRRTTRWIAAVAVAGAAVVAPLAPAAQAGERPLVVRDLQRDVALTIPPLSECPSGEVAALDIELQLNLHLVETSSTYHFVLTQVGTFVQRSATGEVLGSGRFTTQDVDQGPGFPTQTLTIRTQATGRTVDGDPIRVHLSTHATVTPSGELVVLKIVEDCAG